MNTKSKATAAALTAAVAVLPLAAAHGDEYRYIISGDPVAAATVNSCAVASPGTALEAGALSSPTASESLEARCRTWRESSGTALRSDKTGLTIVIR